VRVGLHLLWGVTTVACVYPFASVRVRRALKQRWSRQLLETLGMRLKVGAGTTAMPPCALLVCNHISWLDIFAINAMTPAAFVSKDEVRGWPLIGWLCANTETIFLERGSRAAAQRTLDTMAAHLRSGVPVAVFPEGTTSGGERVLPFHAALFQGAIDAQAAVVPLALRYADRRRSPTRAPAYDGDITLWQSLQAIARADGLRADLRLLPAIAAGDVSRRALARHCHASIAYHIGGGVRNAPEACSDESGMASPGPVIAN